jgi:SAM-dependent methyltransferase
MELLGKLRYSPEGRAFGTVVPGLRKRFLMHRLYRLPLLGRLIRVATSLVALPALMRDVIALSSDLRAMQDRMAYGEARIEQGDQALRDRIAHAEHASRKQAEQSEHMLRGRMDRAHQTFEREFKNQAEIAERAARLQRAHEQRMDGFAARFDAEPWAGAILELARRGEAQATRMDEIGRTLASQVRDDRAVAELSQFVAALRQELSQGSGGAADDNETIAGRLANLLVEQRNLARRAVAAAEESRVGLRDQERRLSLILGELRGWMAHGLAPDAPEVVQDHQERLLDPLYVAFEDRFRGSRADIKQRQGVYLELLREAGAGQPGRPIVDVGSGRGELLELLGDEGLQARGVDLNRSMVEFCNRAGLDCTHGDAVAYLGRLDAGSLGAVTGFHIIEHLPFAVFVALLDASLRALAPGGVIVFETPNPANLLVASRWFHLDPTHRNPLPAEMVGMIAEARGFTRVSIRELHPMAQRFEAKDDVLAAQLDAIFHGPQDYALIARKP